MLAIAFINNGGGEGKVEDGVEQVLVITVIQ